MSTPNDKDDLPFQDVFANAVTDDDERMNLLATKWTTVLKYPFPTRYTFLFVSLKKYWNESQTGGDAGQIFKSREATVFI